MVGSNTWSEPVRTGSSACMVTRPHKYYEDGRGTPFTLCSAKNEAMSMHNPHPAERIQKREEDA